MKSGEGVVKRRLRGQMGKEVKIATPHATEGGVNPPEGQQKGGFSFCFEALKGLVQILSSS
jgi:hypothetical protein